MTGGKNTRTRMRRFPMLNCRSHMQTKFTLQRCGDVQENPKHRHKQKHGRGYTLARAQNKAHVTKTRIHTHEMDQNPQIGPRFSPHTSESVTRFCPALFSHLDHSSTLTHDSTSPKVSQSFCATALSASQSDGVQHGSTSSSFLHHRMNLASCPNNSRRDVSCTEQPPIISKKNVFMSVFTKTI